MKFFRLILSCALIMLSLSGCSQLIDSAIGIEDYTANIFNNYYFSHSSSLINDKIYINSDEPIAEGLVYKYAYDKTNGYIVAHLMKVKSNDSPESEVLYIRKYRYKDFSIVYDKFIVLTCFEDNKVETFDSENDAVTYCKKKGVKLSNWFYTGVDKSTEQTEDPLNNNYSLATILNDYSVIKLDGKEIIRGIITDCKTDEDNISFRLRQVDYGYDEEIIGSVNIELSPLNKESVGKYRTKGFWLSDNVYYDKVITINTITHKITEK